MWPYARFDDQIKPFLISAQEIDYHQVLLTVLWIPLLFGHSGDTAAYPNPYEGTA